MHLYNYPFFSSSFEEHMDMLSRIRLPNSLVESCCAPQLMMESSVAATQVSFLQELHKSAHRKSSLKDGNLNLLDWMSSYDKRGSLDVVLSKFREALCKLKDEVAERIAREIPDALRLANELAQEHRVVQGLENRLTQMSTYQNKAEVRSRGQTELMSVSAVTGIILFTLKTCWCFHLIHFIALIFFLFNSVISLEQKFRRLNTYVSPMIIFFYECGNTVTSLTQLEQLILKNAFCHSANFVKMRVPFAGNHSTGSCLKPYSSSKDLHDLLLCFLRS